MSGPAWVRGATSRRVDRDDDQLAGGEVLKAFGRAVVRRRRELGISQERLAQIAGINRGYMGDVERGARNVGLVNVAKIARALDCTIGELFTRYYEG